MQVNEQHFETREEDFEQMNETAGNFILALRNSGKAINGILLLLL
jgi:hypothetical protein